MNFCVTDGESVIATRYINSRYDEAASLVRLPRFVDSHSDVTASSVMQWFSSGSTFSEYADGGHYKMSKTDKRENIILVRALYCPERAFGLIRILIYRLPASH